MLQHNPFAEINMRLALAPAAAELVGDQSPLVLASRAMCEPFRAGRAPVLTTLPHQVAHRHLQRRKRALIRLDPAVGIKTDVMKFYPSVEPGVVELDLRAVAGPSVASDARLTLEKYTVDSGVPGLPIGPESSGWLANAVLADGDRALERSIGVIPLRWMDDLYQLDGVPAIVEESHHRWSASLLERNLRISPPKTARSWEMGITGGQILMLGGESHGDITAAVFVGDADLLAAQLFDELRKDRPHGSRLNHLLGSACNYRVEHSQLTEMIVDYMLSHPQSWEGSCPRAVLYLTRYAACDQQERMIATANDLNAEGMVASEQVIGLCRAATEGTIRISAGRRGVAARLLLQLARGSQCVPLRVAARNAAHRLDPLHVKRQTIDTGEFDDLHAFEQRVAISFADPRWHHWWLEEQASGRWPITAEWRRNTR